MNRASTIRESSETKPTYNAYGMTEICATIKDLKYERVMVPTTSLISPVQKTDGPWRMTVDSHKLD